MLRRTHSIIAPWHIVRADSKKLARLNVMRDILNRLHYKNKDDKLISPDSRLVFEFGEACLNDGRLAR